MNEDKSRQRLGRGLASLIGTGGIVPPRPMPGHGGSEAAPAAIPAERFVALDRISPNPNNPRRRFDEADLNDLAASIKNHGVVQPLLLRPKPGQPESFEIVAGERRWRAAQAAGLSEVPVVLRDIGDRQSLEIAIIENVQRADLNAVEEAQAYETLIDEHGYTQSDLADVLGKSRSHVANTLRLLKLPEAVRGMVVDGTLSPGAARTVVTADDPLALANDIVVRGLSVREAEDLARKSAETVEDQPLKPARKRKRKAAAERDADVVALENLLAQALGMPVEIRVEGERGSIRIDYADLEQLDEICGLLQTRTQRRAGQEPRVRGL
ncbi:MAG TPA: ParB/RepB/Spo0J family partition protein [Aurantimonas sp.]|uniref:ParB/RepB/Spo0J family partition protein n=1 Tax=Aurantimonas marianensis TaxID=2920428 RepID=A0A9X2HGU6_9HYPH|nr:ParB/RepB/Spo0J family partition protein [Aurantimonas marianensis]MCP3056774.1 ParB/RepB/Spo0J family partition protein [Aurantimonas marianensis]